MGVDDDASGCLRSLHADRKCWLRRRDRGTKRHARGIDSKDASARRAPRCCNPAQSKKKSGADDPIRTDDLLITSELLYQLSYVGSDCRGGG